MNVKKRDFRFICIWCLSSSMEKTGDDSYFVSVIFVADLN